VAGLSSVDPTFPLHLWDRLLPQAEITLNLLRTPIRHPQLSAVSHFHGLMDYIKTAFAPPGCKVIAHKKPGKRRTWTPHGQHGYDVGPAMHHYRCQDVYISGTASKRIMDTLDFFPHNYHMPHLSSPYKTLTRSYHSLTSGMTPSQHLQRWRKFSNSNYRHFKLPPFQLRLPRPLCAHASPNNPIQY
jgi:hypothetical protein